LLFSPKEIVPRSKAPQGTFVINQLQQHLTPEIVAYGRQKPAGSNLAAKLCRQTLAEQIYIFNVHLL
jgi:hypothetical protein